MYLLIKEKPYIINMSVKEEENGTKIEYHLTECNEYMIRRGVDVFELSKEVDQEEKELFYKKVKKFEEIVTTKSVLRLKLSTQEEPKIQYNRIHKMML